jgi:hypothetical protein
MMVVMFFFFSLWLSRAVSGVGEDTREGTQSWIIVFSTLSHSSSYFYGLYYCKP